MNETYRYGRYLKLPDRGVDFWGDCFLYYCSGDITISPTDMRYNGAVITGILDYADCFNSPNVTDPLTLNIQGIHEYLHTLKIMTTKSAAGSQETTNSLYNV